MHKLSRRLPALLLALCMGLLSLTACGPKPPAFTSQPGVSYATLISDMTR